MKATRFLLVLLALTSSTFAEDNASKLKLAREIISAMQLDKMVDNITAQTKQIMAMTALPDGATPEQRKQFETLQGKVSGLTQDFAKGMLSKMDQIYAEVYSEAELKAMKTFLTSVEGQSMTAKQPVVMGKLMPLIKEMQAEMQPKIQKLIEEEMKSSK